MAEGHRAGAARSVLDGGEHVARLDQDGPHREDAQATMNDTNLMQQALGLPPPWTVTGARFDAEAHRLDIEIDFAQGTAASPARPAARRIARPTTQSG